MTKLDDQSPHPQNPRRRIIVLHEGEPDPSWEQWRRKRFAGLIAIGTLRRLRRLAQAEGSEEGDPGGRGPRGGSLTEASARWAVGVTVPRMTRRDSPPRGSYYAHMTADERLTRAAKILGLGALRSVEAGDIERSRARTLVAEPDVESPVAKAGTRRGRAGEALRLAQAWQAEIESGGITRADISRREGLSRARVTQVMALLDLPDDVQQRLLDGEEQWSIRQALRVAGGGAAMLVSVNSGRRVDGDGECSQPEGPDAQGDPGVDGAHDHQDDAAVRPLVARREARGGGGARRGLSATGRCEVRVSESEAGP